MLISTLVLILKARYNCKKRNLLAVLHAYKNFRGENNFRRQAGTKAGVGEGVEWKYFALYRKTPQCLLIYCIIII